MIIPSEIKQYYSTVQPFLKNQKIYIDSVLKQISDKYDGVYMSNIKPVDSLVQRIQVGNIKNIDDLIDLFRATIIVATKKEIQSVK